MDLFTDVLSNVFVSNKSSSNNIKIDKNDNDIELKTNCKSKYKSKSKELSKYETVNSSQYDIDSFESYLFETYENLDNYTKNVFVVNKYYNNFTETLTELLLHISYNSTANKTKNYGRTISVVCDSRNKKVYNKILLEYPNLVFTDFKFFYIDMLKNDSGKLNEFLEYTKSCSGEEFKSIFVFENPEILQIMLSANTEYDDFSERFQILTYVNYNYLYCSDKKSCDEMNSVTVNKDVVSDTIVKNNGVKIHSIITELNSEDWVIFHKKDFEKKSELVFYNNFLIGEASSELYKSKKYTKNKNYEFLKYFNKIHKNIGLRYIILPVDGKN